MQVDTRSIAGNFYHNGNRKNTNATINSSHGEKKLYIHQDTQTHMEKHTSICEIIIIISIATEVSIAIVFLRNGYKLYAAPRHRPHHAPGQRKTEHERKRERVYT